jgi:sec-independent protein translocase protein TatA
MGIENPIHLLFLGLVALLVLGPKRLPELARTLGHGIREFRETISGATVARADLAPPPVAATAPEAPPHEATAPGATTGTAGAPPAAAPAPAPASDASGVDPA